jgi:hypothetical protein
LEYVPILLGAVRTLMLLGDENAFPNYLEDAAACATGQLTLTINSTAGINQVSRDVTLTTNSNVSTGAIQLSYSSASGNYTGNGPLNYNSYSFAEQEPTATDCSSGAGDSGVANLTVLFDLNSFLQGADPSQIRMNVEYIATVTETSIVCEIFPGPPSSTFTQTFDDTIYYLSSLDYAESSVLQPGETTFPYFLNVNSTQTFNFTGTVSPGGVTITGTESTTMTLEQQNP